MTLGDRLGLRQLTVTVAGGNDNYDNLADYNYQPHYTGLT